MGPYDHLPKAELPHRAGPQLPAIMAGREGEHRCGLVCTDFPFRLFDKTFTAQHCSPLALTLAVLSRLGRSAGWLTGLAGL